MKKEEEEKKKKIPRTRRHISEDLILCYFTFKFCGILKPVFCISPNTSTSNTKGKEDLWLSSKQLECLKLRRIAGGLSPVTFFFRL